MEYRTFKRSRGFNLVEAAIVLGVVGLIIGGIWVAAATVTENRKLNAAIISVNQIEKNIQNVLGPFHTTLNQISRRNPALLNGSEGIHYDTASDQLLDPWGNAMNFDHFSATTWQLGFYDLTKARCIKLVTSISQSYQANTLWRMDVPSGNSPTAFPIDLALANTYCTGGTTLYMMFGL